MFQYQIGILDDPILYFRPYTVIQHLLASHLDDCEHPKHQLQVIFQLVLVNEMQLNQFDHLDQQRFIFQTDSRTSQFLSIL